MRYYKILNESECHNGLQYRDGLNVDPVPFQEEGSCVPGGIYFASKDILAFLDMGPWIREVTLPSDAKWVKDPSEPEKFRANRVVLGPRRKITAPVVEELLDEGADVHARCDEALLLASAHGHLKVVKLLLKHGADVHAHDDRALRLASKKGHLEVVKLLLQHGADVHAGNDVALRLAMANGHLEVVKLLLKHGADVHADNDVALRWASANGHLEVVKLLLEYGAIADL